MDFFIEFKIADTSDPFRDPEDPLKPQEGDFRFENDSDNARLVRGQLASYAAAHAGCQFCVHIFCVLHLYAESMQGSFVGTVMVPPLPGASTISKSPNFSLASFGVTHTLIVLSRDTTHPSHQRHQKISNKCSISKAVFERTTLLIANSVHLWFRTVTTQVSKRDLSYHFLQSTPLAHRSDEQLDPCWLSTWKRERSSF